MNIVCDKTLLSAAIDGVSKAVTMRSSIPVLEGILLKAEGFQLTLTGYDLEMGIVTTIEANIKEPGEIVLNAKLLSSMISRMPAGQISIVAADNGKTTIQSGVAQFEIQSMAATDFPELPNTGAEETLTIKTGVLRDMIDRTLYAVSQDEKKPAHTGELFERNGEGLLTVVAVDGYRLALRRETTQLNVSETACQFVIPAPALNEVSKICGDTDETVEIVQGSRHIMFRLESEKITLITRRLEGDFLNYNQAIPTNNPIAISVDRKKLISCIERCSLIITEQQKSPLRCTFGDGVLDIRTATAIGTAQDQCPMVGNGNGLEIGFNNKYILDALKAANAETLRISLNTPISPCIIQPEEGDNQDQFLYMVLPVRLKAGQ